MRLVVVPTTAAVLAWVVLFVFSGDEVPRHVVAHSGLAYLLPFLAVVSGTTAVISSAGADRP